MDGYEAVAWVASEVLKKRSERFRKLPMFNGNAAQHSIRPKPTLRYGLGIIPINRSNGNVHRAVLEDVLMEMQRQMMVWMESQVEERASYFLIQCRYLLQNPLSQALVY